MGSYYTVEPGGKIVKVNNVREWAHWDERVKREDEQNPHGVQFLDGGYRVAWTDLEGGGFVSTAFLGLDHGFGGPIPVLFETMIFKEEEWGAQWRYTSLEEALAGHEHAVKIAKGEITEEDES